MGAACAALLAAGPAVAADYEVKPIDTKKLVVEPSAAAAKLAAGTINVVGQTAAQAAENDGFIKTFNNLFKTRKSTNLPTQAGYSPIPDPRAFKSVYYNSPFQPQLPIMAPARR